jgi:hypothetical protein
VFKTCMLRQPVHAKFSAFALVYRRLEAEFGEEKVDRARDIFSQYKRQNIGTGHDEVVATADLRGEHDAQNAAHKPLENAKLKRAHTVLGGLGR